ncbi:MAG: hypothetical protein JNL02_11475 [Saprospiraceae bacterium]|nr:hypothetical protein [Saprospiraceae bacterium]
MPLFRIPVFLFLLFSFLTARAQTLHYTITRDFSDDGKKSLLDVTVKFYPKAEDTTWFELPTQMNWSEDLVRCFRNFRVEGKGGRYTRHPRYRHIVGVISQSAEPLTLRYEVWPNFKGEAVTLQNSSSPILQKDYLHIHGRCLFLTPLHYEINDFYDVSIDWLNLPKRWTIQTSYNSGQYHQSFRAYSLDWRNSLCVAGDFRIYKGEVLGKPVYFAIRGKWVFDDQTLFDVILKTIETQRLLWNDTDIPYYSVTMIPFVRPEKPTPGIWTGDYLGLGKYNSFAVYATDGCLLDNLIYLFNHEMMHDWIGLKINPGDYDSEAAPRWFAEGFTEYLALRNCWKAGFFDREDFFKRLNKENFEEHYTNRMSEISAHDAEQCFYYDQECEHVPYRRGFILAFYFDCAIRKNSNNEYDLHDFMLNLLEYYQNSDRSVDETFDFFTETLGEFLGEDPTPFLNTHAIEGKRIPPEKFVLPDYLQMTVSTKGVPQFSIKAGADEADFLK